MQDVCPPFSHYYLENIDTCIQNSSRFLTSTAWESCQSHIGSVHERHAGQGRTVLVLLEFELLLAISLHLWYIFDVLEHFAGKSSCSMLCLQILALFQVQTVSEDGNSFSVDAVLSCFALSLKCLSRIFIVSTQAAVYVSNINRHFVHHLLSFPGVFENWDLWKARVGGMVAFGACYLLSMIFEMFSRMYWIDI